MRYALILMAFGLATTAAARPAPSTATDGASGAPLRSSCTLSRLDADARQAVALDCTIHDIRAGRAARTEAAVVQMASAPVSAGVVVVAGAPRAARAARPDLALRAVIDTSAAPVGDTAAGEVVLDPKSAASRDRIEVIASAR